jgi:dUTP diphosphatase
MLKIKIKKLHAEAKVPCYARIGDAGMDVIAVSKEIKEKFVEYGTGLAFELPVDYAMLIFPRSSVTKKDLMLANCVGVLDSGYRGELIIRFRRTGEDDYNIGERIAQLMVIPYPNINFEEAGELSSTERGEGRFGHTGA